MKYKLIGLYIVLILTVIILPYFYDYINYKKYNKVIICGCARDVEKYLSKILIKIDDITKLFNDYYIIIYENDSKDNTQQILLDYKKKHKNKCHMIIENNVNNKYPLRTHRLAHARNTILDYIYDNKLDKRFDYYLNMDLDDVNLNLDVNSIKRVLNDKLDWDVVSANQLNRYYDYWALRTTKYNENCWDNGLCSKKKETLDNWFDIKNKKNINIDNPPLKVLSAFGGLAIYKMNKIKNCRYNGIYNNDYTKEDCEHVIFHREIRKKNLGDKQYIVPYLTNN
jgi:hypothetical protein